MQAEQQVWEDRVEVGAAQVHGRQLSHRHPAGAAAEGEAPAFAGNRHVDDEEGAVHEIVLPGRVRRELRQLGMDHGAMQADRVVLEDEHPVRTHDVVAAAGGAQVRDVEAREPADEGRERLRERLGVRREVDQQEPLPLGEGWGAERVIPLVEAFHLAHVGGADELAVEGVGPGVVGALDRLGQAAAPLLAQPRPSVAADIVMRPQRAALVAQHDHALARDVGEEVVSRVGELRGAAHAHPAASENPLHLLREDLGRRVVAPRQGARALAVHLGGLEERGHDRSTGTITSYHAAAPAGGASLAGPARPCSLTRMAKSSLPLVAWALLYGGPPALGAQQDAASRAGLERPIALPSGERRGVELGYGVSHVEIDSLAAAGSVTTLAQLLTGRIAGLVVMQSSGTIGAGSRLLNRGATSLFVSNAPLLYVDGVRADQSPNAYGLDVGGQVPSRFDDVDPADIAAVDALRRRRPVARAGRRLRAAHGGSRSAHRAGEWVEAARGCPDPQLPEPEERARQRGLPRLTARGRVARRRIPLERRPDAAQRQQHPRRPAERLPRVRGLHDQRRMGVLPARRRVPDPHQPGGGAAHGEPPRHVASAVIPGNEITRRDGSRALVGPTGASTRRGTEYSVPASRADNYGARCPSP